MAGFIHPSIPFKIHRNVKRSYLTCVFQLYTAVSVCRDQNGNGWSTACNSSTMPNGTGRDAFHQRVLRYPFRPRTYQRILEWV